MHRIALFALICLCGAVFGETPAQKPAAPAVLADQTTPKGTVKLFALSIQKGDSSKVAGCLKSNTELEEKYANGYVEVAIGLGKLQSAVRTKFGEVASHQWAGFSGIAEVDAAKEQVSGDTAMVEISGSNPLKLELLKDGGQWKISVAKMIDGKKPAQINTEIKGMQVLARAASDTATEVADGKFAKPEQVREALEQKLSKAAGQK